MDLYNDIHHDVPKIGKIDAAHITDDNSVGCQNIEPPIAESKSALKTGLDTMLWRCIIVIGR